MTNVDAPVLGRRLAWNSLLNALGQGAPAVVAVFAVPVLVHALGLERFGILSLAWIVVGYFSLFDFGLGRALTQVVAERRAAGDQAGVNAVVVACLSAMLGLGLVGFIAAEVASPWLVQDTLKITPALRAEALTAFRILAAGVPIVIMGAGLRGALEAYERFDLVNAIRAPLGVANYLGPMLLLPFTHRLPAVVSVLVIARALSLAATVVCYRRVVGPFRRTSITADGVLPVVLRSGSWMTVSNLVGPIMTYADRFVIGRLMSAAVVAVYSAPFDMVSRLMIVPAAVTSTLFPAFAGNENKRHTADLFARGLMMTSLGLFSVTLVVVLFAHEGMALWLGADFANRSAGVLQILAIGVFINCFAQIAFALVQGVGRADLAARANLAEVPFYLGLVWWLVESRGLEGAALAWTARVAVDAVIMFWLAARVVPEVRDRRFARVWIFNLGAVALLSASLAASRTPFGARALLVAIVTPLAVAIGWRWGASPDERRQIALLVSRWSAFLRTAESP
jgi:O-antigen/teichoic acid export membrane protein